MSSLYNTIAEKSEGIYREKMSKFIAFACPVDNEIEAKSFIDDIRNKYHDARHVCWAYMLGADRKIFMSNDDGEPSGTAGKPILGQINSFGLTNIAIAVVRYFGGIKLGTSGLIGAYREAARIALADSVIIEKAEETAMELSFGYVVMNDVMRIIKNNDLKILDRNFDNTCKMSVMVRKDKVEYFKSLFESVEGVSVTHG